MSISWSRRGRSSGSIGWAVVAHGGIPAAALGSGTLAHLACAALGIAVGRRD